MDDGEKYQLDHLTFGELFRWASPRQGIGKPRDGLSLVRGTASRPSFTEKKDFPFENIFPK